MDGMEIYDENGIQEVPEPAQASSSKATATPTVVIDDAHPFDLEAYIAGYSGRSAIDRLLHIVSHSPALAPQALKRALGLVVELFQRDTTLLTPILSAHGGMAEQQNTDESSSDATVPDLTAYHRWLEQTNYRNSEERIKLEVELKTYTNNMIKESIRLAHRDLAAFHRSCGAFELSLRHYTKSREFCTTPAHMLEMCLSVLELLIEHRNYAHITTYVFKGESALDAAVAQSHSASNATSGGNSNTSSSRRGDHFRAIEAKLALASGLSFLHSRGYAKAAAKFLVPNVPSGLVPWTGTLLHPGDQGIYGTLCALATMDRPEIKRRYAAGDSALGEGEGMKDLVDSWLSSRFRSVIQLLERYSTRFMLDPLLAPHVAGLTQLIRARALTLYFQPFSTIRLERMSAAFGWSVEETEREVVALIRSGDIHGRVDSQNKILRARHIDPRTQLYNHALRAGAEMEKATQKLLLRMQLQQADLVVRKAPGSGQTSEYPTPVAS